MNSRIVDLTKELSLSFGRKEVSNPKSVFSAQPGWMEDLGKIIS